MTTDLPAKKKLLIATDNFLPRWDGIARFLKEVLPFLSVDFDITVVAPNFPGKKDLLSGIRVVRIPLNRFRVGDYNIPKLRFRLMRQLVSESDIVWIQTIGPIGGLAAFYGRRLEKAVIAYAHSIEWELVRESIGKNRSLVESLTKPFIRWLYNKCDLIMVPSKDVKDLFHREGIIVQKKVVHLGVNTRVFVPARNRSEMKTRLGWDQSKVYIGFHGRIGREKDLPTLHKAFLELRKIHPHVELVIIGTGVPEITDLFKGDGMHNLGVIDNVIPYLQAIDVYVLPSLTETTSLSTMEAMSCGCAVITTPVGYIRRYILPGYNGYFFPAGDSVDLSKKLDKLVTNADMRHMAGSNARKTIVTYYRWADSVEKIRSVLKEF